MSALATAYADITLVVRDLDDQEFLLPSGCRGWSIADLLLHVTLDAQRALIAFATPTSAPADVDSVSYWRTLPGAADPEGAWEHCQWVRRSAAAFARPSGVARLWTETAAAAVRAAAAAEPTTPACSPGGNRAPTRVRTQGHVLTVTDFADTLVTEAAIHHLDLIVSLPDAVEPAPEVIAVAASTLDGLAAPDGLPPHWDAREKLRKATGRTALDAADRRALGGRTLPLLS